MRRVIPPIVCPSCETEVSPEGQCDDTLALISQLDNGAVIQLTKTVGAGFAHQHTYHYTVIEISDLFGCNFDGGIAPEI